MYPGLRRGYCFRRPFRTVSIPFPDAISVCLCSLSSTRVLKTCALWLTQHHGTPSDTSLQLATITVAGTSCFIKKLNLYVWSAVKMLNKIPQHYLLRRMLSSVAKFSNLPFSFLEKYILFTTLATDSANGMKEISLKCFINRSSGPAPSLSAISPH